MKTTPPPALRFPIGPLRDDGSVSRCHNLRPAAAGSSLVPVGPPRHLTSQVIPGAGLLPGGVFRDSAGVLTLFFADDSGLLCFDGQEVYRPAGASGTPRCAVATGESLLLMTSEGEDPQMLSRDSLSGLWTARSASELPPPLTIERTDRGLISATIDARSLRGSYSSRSAGLTSADLASMQSALTEAYLAIGDRAVARRVFFQPVIARYRLRGTDGRVIYTSQPVLLGPDSGPQLTGAIFSLSGASLSEVAATTLTARTFSLRLRGSLDGLWSRAVSSVELQVSPQLHPLEENLRAAHTLGSFTATSAMLSLRLPGVHDSLASPAEPATLLSSQVATVLARLDSGSLETLGSARFDSAAGEWEGLENPWYADRRDCRADLKALRSVTGAPVKPLTPVGEAIRALSPPHVMSASVMGLSGDCIVAGGLSARRFSGSLPAEMAVKLDSGSGEVQPMAVKVVFADGSSVVRSAVGKSPAVSLLSPLLVYPSPDAVEMRLYCGRSVLRVSLRPDPSGSMAYWLHPSAAPVELTESLPAFVLPASAPVSRRFPGMLAVSTLASPLSPQAAVENAGSAPVAITAAVGGASGWDSESSRFYLFGQSGIQSLTVNSSRSRLTVRTLDPRPTSGSEAVCVTSASVAAIAGGDLVSVSGRRVTTLRPSAGAVRLGYSGAADELWCFPAEAAEPVAVTSPDGRVRFTRSCQPLASLLSHPPGLWGAGADGRLYDLTQELDEECEIAFAASVSVSPGAPSALWRRFVMPFRGQVGEGSVSLLGDNGCGGAYSDLLASYEIAGLLTHLPPVALHAPHRHRFTLSLTARVAVGDFRIGQY